MLEEEQWGFFFAHERGHMAKQGKGRRKANPVARALRSSGTPYGHKVERSKKEYRRTPKHRGAAGADIADDPADVAGDVGAIVVSTVLDTFE